MEELTVSEYASKPMGYFEGARTAFVDDLPRNPSARLLEIGCGNGATSAYATATGKCGWAAGVELCAVPASAAAEKVNEIILGDIESTQLPYPPQHFDVLIMSEVLEHLRDPWSVLKMLRPLLKSGACVLAGTPNVAHHSVLRMLLGGSWDYAEVGLLDKTHLRWFTPSTLRQLFQDCGYRVDFVGPADPLRFKAAWFNRLTLGQFEYLLHTQIYLRAGVK
jgi:2-polyprenyl-3-methyl-5-hydroxy-6-metoxy-1,4-benzoquinol methylase